MPERPNYVTWKIFVWAIGIVTLVIGWQFIAFARLADSVKENSVNGYSIQAQLSQIQTDLQWIKTTLSDHRKSE